MHDKVVAALVITLIAVHGRAALPSDREAGWSVTAFRPAEQMRAEAARVVVLEIVNGSSRDVAVLTSPIAVVPDLVAADPVAAAATTQPVTARLEMICAGAAAATDQGETRILEASGGRIAPFIEDVVPAGGSKLVKVDLGPAAAAGGARAVKFRLHAGTHVLAETGWLPVRTAR